MEHSSGDGRARRLLEEVNARLVHAHRQARCLEDELQALERRVAALEHDVSSIDPEKNVSPLASLRVGLAAPLTVLAMAGFFDIGVWPLGLAAGGLLLLQVFLVPLLSWRSR